MTKPIIYRINKVIPEENVVSMIRSTISNIDSSSTIYSSGLHSYTAIIKKNISPMKIKDYFIRSVNSL